MHVKATNEAEHGVFCTKNVSSSLSRLHVVREWISVLKYSCKTDNFSFALCSIFVLLLEPCEDDSSEACVPYQ